MKKASFVNVLQAKNINVHKLYPVANTEFWPRTREQVREVLNNSLLYCLPNSNIMKLQRIQNAAARLVTGTPRFCHVTPLLFHLHWLPISYRIKFKILLLTFKCLYGQAPNYLIDFITIKKQSRYSLRSNESIFLELPGIKTHPTLGDRTFQSAVPYLWNALPSAIRNMKTLGTFKTVVKTLFFFLLSF